MTSLFEKIKKYKEENKLQHLQKLINDIDGKELINMMKSKLVDPHASRVLGYIFETLSNSKADEAKRILLIEGVLKETPKQRLTNKQTNSLIMRLAIEVDKLPTNHLIKLTEYCLNQLQKDNPDSNSWKDLLPKLLYLLQGKSSVDHSGSEMTGAEYKSQVIHSLCLANWGSSIITMLADMFSEVPLTDEEMGQVTNKLYSGMVDLEPSEVPPLVHQLLKVCGEQCCLTLLMHVQQYYANRLGGLDTADDSDAISAASVMETKQSEGTVLFHIRHCASFGRANIRLMLKTLKSMAQAPEVIFGGPLLLPSALLMIASLSPYKDTVLGLMVTAIMEAVQDEEQRRHSSWVKELVPSQKNLQKVLENIIDETPTGRDMVLEGLMALCFELLRTKPAGRTEKTAERIWTLSSSILMYLITKKPYTLSAVVQKLVENFTRPSKHVTQFVRCFQQMACSKPRQVLQSHEFLSFFLIDQLMVISAPVAEQAVLSLIPVLNLSESLCNALILILRKALNIPRVNTRQMAVTSLLLMMQKLKVRKIGTGFLSQGNDSPSGSTSSQVITQVYLPIKMERDRKPTRTLPPESRWLGEILKAQIFRTGVLSVPSRFLQAIYSPVMTNVSVHASTSSSIRNPEAMSLELLQMLKHTFTFQAEVKLRLYQGMYEMATCNPEMQFPAVQFLHSHLRKFWELDDDNKKCPLNFDLICKESIDEDAYVLTEPLGHLIFAFTQLLVHAKYNVEEEPKSWFRQVEKEVKYITNKLAQCSLDDLGFDEANNVLEEGAKGSHKQLLLGQIMGVYEALIAYTVRMWSHNQNKGEELSRKVTSLFRIYSTVSDYSKTLKRPAKKKNANDTDVAPANPRKRGRPGSSSSLISIGKSREPSATKIPPILDLGSIHLILTLLYNENIDWAEKDHAEHVRSRLEIHSWSFRTLLASINHVKSVSINTVMDKHSVVFQQLCDIVQVVYQRCVCDLVNLVDNVANTAALALDAFIELLVYVTSSHRHLLQPFLTSMCDVGGGESLETAVHQITECLTGLLEAMLEKMNFNDEQEDVNIKKIPRTLITLLFKSCALLESNDKHLDKVQQLVQDVTRRQEVADDGVVRGVLDLLVTLYARRSGIAHPLSVIIRHLCHLYKTIDEDVELSMAHKNLALIKDEHVPSVTLMVCSRVKETLDQLVLITQRLRCERKMLPYHVNSDRDLLEQEVKGKERGLCNYASSLVDVVILLASMAVTAELAEPVLKVMSSLYSTLTVICRHFSAFSSRSHAAFRGANFENVVRVAGRKLGVTASSFFTHVANTQQERYERLQAGKKFNANVVQKRVQREADCIARTILAMEKFSKAVIQLSAKTKIQLNEHLHLGVSHDFRINSNEVQKALTNLQQAEDSDEEEGSGSEATGNNEEEDKENEEESMEVDENE